MNKVLTIFGAWICWVKLWKVLIKTSVVKNNHNECVDGTNWMVGLPLFNVGVICTGQEHCLPKLDIVHATDKSVLAFTKTTPEMKDAEDGKKPLYHKNKDGDTHQQNACFNMIILY